MALNVLIVDDSAVMSKIVQRSVRQAYNGEIGEVVEAGDGQEALDVLEGNPVSLIFSGINMPNVSGLDFLKKLKDTTHKDLPVIMITTEGGENTVMEAISLGAKGFIRKPFTAEQVQEALTRALPSLLTPSKCGSA